MAGTGSTDDPTVSDLCKFEELANKLPNMRNRRFVDEVMRRGRGGWGREGGRREGRMGEGGEGGGRERKDGGGRREGGEGWGREEGGRRKESVMFLSSSLLLSFV